MSAARVAFFVSPHGFGHAARAAAVIAALGRLGIAVRAEVFTSVARWFFEDSLPGVPFGWHHLVTDVGLVQRSAVEEDAAATAERLAAFFPFPRATLDELARRLDRLGCRAVVADVSPLGLAAARRAGLPSVLLENFTWDWMYRGYVDAEPRLAGYADGLAEVFAGADLRLQAEPVCRPVEGAVRLPPVSRRPRADREAVAKELGLDPGRPLVLLNMGGFGWSWSGGELEREAAGAELVALGGVERPVRQGRVLRLPHRPPVYARDLAAAADLLVGKLGYSTVAEAAASGTRLVFVRRPRSPEFPVLAAWVRDRLPAAPISLAELEGGEWVTRVAELLEREPALEPPRNGDEQAARAIARLVVAAGPDA